MTITSTEPSVTVIFPAALFDRTGGRQTAQLSAPDVRTLVDRLEEQWPGMRFSLCYETGELREFVNIFIGARNVRYLDGLDTPLPSGSTVRILKSVAGG